MVFDEQDAAAVRSGFGRRRDLDGRFPLVDVAEGRHRADGPVVCPRGRAVRRRDPRYADGEGAAPARGAVEIDGTAERSGEIGHQGKPDADAPRPDPPASTR